MNFWLILYRIFRRPRLVRFIIFRSSTWIGLTSRIHFFLQLLNFFFSYSLFAISEFYLCFSSSHWFQAFRSSPHIPFHSRDRNLHEQPRAKDLKRKIKRNWCVWDAPTKSKYKKSHPSSESVATTEILQSFFRPFALPESNTRFLRIKCEYTKMYSDRFAHIHLHEFTYGNQKRADWEIWRNYKIWRKNEKQELQWWVHIL